MLDDVKFHPAFFLEQKFKQLQGKKTRFLDKTCELSSSD